MQSTAHSSDEVYELQFCGLHQESLLLKFPCDAKGHVNLDALSEQALAAYLVARRLVGRDLATPEVRAMAT
jgi:hypothetical protein